MTEFKQIVGRGTRVHEDTHKHYFTLADFRKATNHFADPDFDGEPAQIYQPTEYDPPVPPDDVPLDDEGTPLPPTPRGHLRGDNFIRPSVGVAVEGYSVPAAGVVAAGLSARACGKAAPKVSV